MRKEIGRNDPCPCGSGKKYKKCCGSPKLSSRSISVVKSGMGSLQERISGATKSGISNASNSLAGRVIASPKTISQEKD
jgi:hypothetical protein